MKPLPPDQVHNTQARESGEQLGWNLPLAYGGSEAEFLAALHGVGLVDLSWYGRIRISGKDATDLLHRLSSNDIQGAPAGCVIDTLFLTDKGRMIDVVTLLPDEGGWMMITSPGRETTVTQWIEHYTFSEDITIRHTADESFLFFLVGPAAPEFCRSTLGMDLPPHKVLPVHIGGRHVQGVRVLTSRWRGTLLLGPAQEGEAMWEWLLAQTGGPHLTPVGYRAFDAIRIRNGWPFPGKEIDDAYNPFDIGMTGAVSTTKGCYIGQEVVARLDTYQKVRRGLRGLRLSGPMQQPRTVLSLEGAPVGWITSCMEQPLDGRVLGLGVLQTSVPAGAELAIAGSTLTAVVTTMPDEP